MKNQLFALLKWFYMIFFNNCRSTILSKPGGKLHFSILVWSIKPLIYVICDPDRKEEKTRGMLSCYSNQNSWLLRRPRWRPFVSMSYFYKSTLKGKRKWKLWQHWNAPCHANGAQWKVKKQQQWQKKVGCFLPVHQPHPHLHCCQFTDLQAVSSSAGHPLPHPYAQTENQQLWPWSGGWGQGSKVLVEIGGGCLTCSGSLVEPFCIPRQPLCFDLVLIDRRQVELVDNQRGSLIGQLSRGSHHSVSAPSPLLPARLGWRWFPQSDAVQVVSWA